MQRSGAIAHRAESSGTPLIALHGGRLDHRHMAECLEPVLAAWPGYLRIFPDVPGHGASPTDGTATYQDVLDRLTAFVGAVAPAGPLLPAGESRVGCFARALAHRFADRLRGLLLIMPAREVEPGRAESLPADQRWRLDRVATRTARVLEVAYRTKIAALLAVDAAYHGPLEENHLFDDDPDAPGKVVTAPSLILLGRQDSMAGYRAMLAREAQYPHGSVALLDAAAHSLAVERPAVFGALVADWLDRVERAQP